MNDRDVRGRILLDIYSRKREVKEIQTKPEEYAEVLGISREIVNFNLQYLKEKELVKGTSIAVF